MICTSLSDLLSLSMRLDCQSDGLTRIAIILALCITGASGLLAWRLRTKRGIATAALFTLAAVLFAVAAARPALVSESTLASAGRIAVVIDVSDSALRDGVAMQSALARGAEVIAAFTDTLPPEDRALWEGRIITYGTAAESRPAMPLPLLARGLTGVTLPTGQAHSALPAGLMQAQTWLRDSAGPKMALLIGDGHSSAPLEDALLDQLRTDGITVHTLATGAQIPASGLIAADIGPLFRIGEEATLRGTVLGGGSLALIQHDNLGEIAVPPADHLRPLRLTTAFRQRGLQGMTLDFTTPDAQHQSRALYTMVQGPANLLVYGPAPWAQTLPPDRWQVTRAEPHAPLPAADFDLVAIDSLSPADFPADAVADMLAAVDGTGLFVINGPLRGTKEQPQRIADWNDSALGPLMPVDSDPRMFVQDPPPRDIVIMVDVSGSMGGARLQSAQSVMAAIVAQLRPSDTLAILPFASGGEVPFPQTNATPANVARAQGYIAALRTGGGTAPASAIAASARYVSNYCAFFFISDAEFSPPGTAPQCFTTAISVSNSRFQMDVSRWGEEVLLGEGADGSAIRLRYFEPEEREEYYREGLFTPLATDAGGLGAPFPTVGGLAIAYPRVDATVGLLHDSPPPDPLFALRRDGQRPGVVTGVFLGAMGAEWGGTAALSTMLDRLLAWPDQDRYLIRLQDTPAGLQLRVTENRDGGGAALSATLLHASGAAQGIALQFDPRLGSHIGTVPLTGAAHGTRALLSLQQGRDVQRIPLRLPPASAADPVATSEALSFGIAWETLTRISRMTYGQALDRQAWPAYSSVNLQVRVPVHIYLLVLAMVSLAAAVWARSWGRA